MADWIPCSWDKSYSCFPIYTTKYNTLIIHPSNHCCCRSSYSSSSSVSFSSSSPSFFYNQVPLTPSPLSQPLPAGPTKHLPLHRPNPWRILYASFVINRSQRPWMSLGPTNRPTPRLLHVCGFYGACLSRLASASAYLFPARLS